MTSRAVRLLTVGPVFVVATGLVLLRVGGWSALSLLVAGIIALPVLSTLVPRRLGWLLAPSIVLFALVALSTWFSQAIPSGASGDLVAGALLGLPLWFLGVAVGEAERPGVALLTLTAGLLEVVSLGSALALAGPGTMSVGQFLGSWFEVGGRQLGALGSALSNGGLTSGITFPLSGYTDPWFVALAFLALGGALLPMLRPGDSSPLPNVAPPRRDLVPSARRSPPPVLYAEAEPETPAVPPPGAGLVPVAGAVFAVIGLEVVAAAASNFTFLVVTAVAVAALVALYRISQPVRRPSRQRSPGADSAGPPAGRPPDERPAGIQHP